MKLLDRKSKITQMFLDANLNNLLLNRFSATYLRLFATKYFYLSKINDPSLNAASRKLLAYQIEDMQLNLRVN